MNLVIELKNTIEKSLDSIAAAQDEAAALHDWNNTEAPYSYNTTSR